jgi:hypothetical protein
MYSLALIIFVVSEKKAFEHFSIRSNVNLGHSINTGPYRENTEISSSLKLLHWLNLNCASIIGRSFTNFVFFMLIVIPRWLPLQDRISQSNLTSKPKLEMWDVIRSPFQAKHTNDSIFIIMLKINDNMFFACWKVLYKLCVFYVDSNSKMTTTVGHSLYIGPIVFFYNQVNDTGSWEPLVSLAVIISVVKRKTCYRWFLTWW